jgi:uncharacterized membrane protein
MFQETSSAFSPQHIHPILVNFTAALVPISVFSDIVGRFFKKQSLRDVGFWALIYAAAITPLTAAAGLWWRKTLAEAPLPQATIRAHQGLGVTLVILFIVLAIWRWRIFKRNAEVGIPYFVLAIIAVIALIVQGTLGGDMAFG